MKREKQRNLRFVESALSWQCKILINISTEVTMMLNLKKFNRAWWWSSGELACLMTERSRVQYQHFLFRKHGICSLLAHEEEDMAKTGKLIFQFVKNIIFYVALLFFKNETELKCFLFYLPSGFDPSNRIRAAEVSTSPLFLSIQPLGGAP